MALPKLFTKRLFDSSKTTVSFATFDNNILSSPSLYSISKTSYHQREYLTSSEPTRRRFLRRFLAGRSVYNSAPFLSIPVGDKLREKLKCMSFIVDFDKHNLLTAPGNGITVEDVRKIMRATQVEKVKAKLMDIPETSISYTEFLRVCVEACQNNSDQGVEFAKMLDQCGNVIVLGNVVILRPQQVTKTIESLIYQSVASPNDPRRNELEQMEKQKEIIDDKAKAHVRAELYCGLGFLMVQTLGFMRLTFWELSWDVMEPICFFVTSIYFVFAYLFFMRTSTEPTFQGYFYRRFKRKQERLMKAYNFDIHRYNELYKACHPSYFPGAKSEPSPPPLQTHIRDF